jgi:large conductance mechanosensitive channel
MGFIAEFKEFALKGNVLDLAVGVIIGAAFGKIVNSIIEDVVMPVVGLAGNVDFTNAYWPLTGKVSEAVKKAAEAGKPLGLLDARKEGPVLAWGNFLTITINFLILAFCIFIVVKLFNTARKRFEAEKPVPPPPGPTKEELLLTDIRDLLAKGR